MGVGHWAGYSNQIRNTSPQKSQRMTMKRTPVSFEESTTQSTPLVAACTSPKHRWRPSTPCTPRSTTLTPSKSATLCDRYVPSRSAGDIEFSRFQMNNTPLSKCILKSTENIPSVGKPSDADESKFSMRERLLALKGQSSENRVLSFNQSLSNQLITNTTTPEKCEGVYVHKIFCGLCSRSLMTSPLDIGFTMRTFFPMKSSFVEWAGLWG